MPSKRRSKPYRVGMRGSTVVTLPADWVRANLTGNDEEEVEVEYDDVVIIRKVPPEESGPRSRR